MSLYAFHLGQIILTVLGQVDHDGQHGNAARTPIRGETSETDHTQKRRFRHTAIYQTISTNISQENDHAIIIVKRQFVACNFR